MPLYPVFIDLTKAFKTLIRKTVWTILESRGCQRKFVMIGQLFLGDKTGRVLTNGDVIEAFEINNGMKRGRVLALVFFKLFSTCMMAHAVQDFEKGVYIPYCLDGSLFDLRRLTATTKSLNYPIHEALYVDNYAFVDHGGSDLLLVLDSLSEVLRSWKIPHTRSSVHPINTLARSCHNP